MADKFKILKSIDSHKNIIIELNEKGKETKKIKETKEKNIVTYWIYAPKDYKESGKLHATGGYLDFEEALKVCKRINKFMEK